MPFGVVRGVGRGMGVLDGGGDRRREGAVLGVNLGRPIVTNGSFATQLFSNYFEDLFYYSSVLHHQVVDRFCTRMSTFFL